MSAFASALHPRAQGGKFTTTVNGVQVPASLGRLYQQFGSGSNAMSFNGMTGTGYGVPGGDQRVKYLQRLLNRLGLRDMNGQPLRVDGELGPLTTSAIKAAQAKLGVKQDGVVTPALMAAILKLPRPKLAPKGAKSPRAHHGRARRKFHDSHL